MITAELMILLIAALATGGLMVNWIGLARAMECLSSSAYVELHQNTNRTFDPCMPIVVVGALLGGLPTAVQINKQIASWSVENPPRDWAQVRARWIRFHILRTLFSVPAFVLYVAASILRTS